MSVNAFNTLLALNMLQCVIKNLQMIYYFGVLSEAKLSNLDLLV